MPGRRGARAKEEKRRQVAAEAMAIWDAGSPLYRIGQTTDRGRTLIANQDIPRGTRIISEPPLFVVALKKNNDPEDVWKALSALTAQQQAQFWMLRAPDGQNLSQGLAEQSQDEKNSRAALVFFANAFALGTEQSPDEEEAKGRAHGVALTGAYINHCCSPNTHATYNPFIGRQTYHAIFDIERDSEITISYISDAYEATRDERQRELIQYNLFHCVCDTCENKNEDLQRLAWKKLLDQFVKAKRLPSMSKMDAAREKLRLVEYDMRAMANQGLFTTWQASWVYGDLARLHAQLRDERSAEAAFQRRRAIMRTCVGEDHPNYHKDTKFLNELKELARSKVRMEEM